MTKILGLYEKEETHKSSETAAKKRNKESFRDNTCVGMIRCTSCMYLCDWREQVLVACMAYGT